jgi:glycosyltransferase involved in cell wall biosynthesis
VIVSIITVNYNNKSGLEKTLSSVFNQTFKEFEYIVIDGGSTDGSTELLKSNNHRINYWVSEKDSGIYNAMNKGIARAKGEYLLFLNSGDYLCNESVLYEVFSEVPTHDIVYGNIIWVENDKYTNGIFPDKLTFNYFTNYSLPHQGSFIHKKLFGTVGLYDERYKIISDWIFFLLAVYKFNCSYKHIDIMITVCSRDGLSCDPVNWPQIVNDRKKIIQQYFSAFSNDNNIFISITKELEEVKSTLGYRLHSRLRKFFQK